MKKNIRTQNNPQPQPNPSLFPYGMTTRAAVPIQPASFDEAAGSVRAIATTEAPARVFDWERWEIIDEILRMDGVVLPDTGQVPLLDSHERHTVSAVLGSAAAFEVDAAGGHRALSCVVTYSKTTEGQSAAQKTREGHLTDYSVGYSVDESYWVPDGEKQIIRGETYTGPVRVVTKWTLKELSATPIGADVFAKARSLATPQGQSNNPKKEIPMDPKLKEKLIERGLAADATDAEAWAYFMTLTGDEKRALTVPQAVPAAPPAAPVDIEAVRAEAIRAERERCESIRSRCRVAGLDEEAAEEMISAGVTIDRAADEIFKRLEVLKPPTGAPARYPATVQADERDKFRAAAEDGLLIRAGMPPKTPARGADELAGYTLREIARESLRVQNMPTGGSVLQMVGRAMLTQDFQNLLRNVAHKSLFQGWENAEETWRIWCDKGSVSDFKTHYSPRVSEFSDLDLIPEGMQYKYGKRTDAQESYSIATYGKLEAITRQAIINDDQRALTGFAAHGQAAARKVGDVAYAVLTANAAMGDGTALFATGHSNYVASGSGGAPGVATLTAAVKAMKLQKDAQNLQYLNIRPVFFLAPVALEGSSEVFFKTVNYVDSNTVATDSSLAATRTNIYADPYLRRVYDARLDAALSTGWYLAAAPGKTVTVFFLDGVEAPYLEERDGWNVDGVEVKVRIDVGAKAMDWRGLYYNYGA